MSFFNQKDTKLLKGIAILLMFMHHMFYFPERIAGQLSSRLEIFDLTDLEYLGSFGKLCVPLFFFLGGYGTYKSYKMGKLDIFEKIKSLYLSYWKIFVIFIPLACIFFANQPAFCTSSDVYERYNYVTGSTIFSNFLGISSSLNGEWWFLFDYVIALACFSFINRILKNKDLLQSIAIVAMVVFLSMNVLSALGDIEYIGVLNNNWIYRRVIVQNRYVSSFWMGIIFAKYDVFESIDSKVKTYVNPVSLIIGIVIISYLRVIAIGNVLDVIYTPVFCILVKYLFEYCGVIRSVLIKIGEQSTNMWLTHSFFCYYFYPVNKYVVYTKDPFVSILTLCVLTYITSIILNQFWKFVGKVIIRRR